MERTAWVTVCLLLWGCSSATAPAETIDGVWNSVNQVPGAGLTLTLAEQDTTVTGTGDYRIEAGRSGTLSVTGSYHRPTARLHFVYDYGRTSDYSAAVNDARHMSGTEKDSAGLSASLTLVKQ